jgi:hypothetical protein
MDRHGLDLTVTAKRETNKAASPFVAIATLLANDHDASYQCRKLKNKREGKARNRV